MDEKTDLKRLSNFSEVIQLLRNTKASELIIWIRLTLAKWACDIDTKKYSEGRAAINWELRQ